MDHQITFFNINSPYKELAIGDSFAFITLEQSLKTNGHGIIFRISENHHPFFIHEMV